MGIPVDGIAGDAVTQGVAPEIEQLGTDVLVGRARTGDREAYGMLFDRFHDEIYRFSTRRVGDPVLGQDIAADTFADAFGAIPRFQWRGVPFEAWLYTIARRRVADALRARGRSEVDVPQSGIRWVPDHAAGVVDSMHLRELIDRLPDGERDVIEMRFMEDLDVAATARRLGKSPGAVRVAQFRAIARLRGLIAEGVA